MEDKLKFLMLLISLVLSFQVHAKSQDKSYAAELSWNHGSGWQNHAVGTTIMRENVHEQVVQYSFALDGGAINSAGVKLRVPASHGGAAAPSATLPKGAIVIGCYIDVITALTTSASGTMALGTGASQTDILGATAASSYTGIVACTPTGTAASAIKLAADVTPKFTIATGAITAGKFNLHIQYLLSDE